MANFVLVHGAWHGGWCWRDVASALRAAGHRVATPTHTGVGERAHQGGADVTLETHIGDVIACIEAEEMNDLILCGHSYGGMVITGVADRLGARVKQLVYLDAFVPQDGQSLLDLVKIALPPEVAGVFVAAFHDSSRVGGRMAPIPAEMFGIKAENRAWVDRRCVAQSLATFTLPLLLRGGTAPGTPRLYILADAWDPSPFRHFAARLEGQADWRVSKLPSSHDVMVDMPQELAAELMALV
jgi:pimeloyl-ACP methyl ester carboxylesterase